MPASTTAANTNNPPTEANKSNQHKDEDEIESKLSTGFFYAPNGWLADKSAKALAFPGSLERSPDTTAAVDSAAVVDRIDPFEAGPWSQTEPIRHFVPRVQDCGCGHRFVARRTDHARARARYALPAAER